MVHVMFREMFRNMSHLRLQHASKDGGDEGVRGVLRGEAPARVWGEVALHGGGQVAGQEGEQLHVQPVQHVSQELVGVLLLVTSAMEIDGNDE